MKHAVVLPTAVILLIYLAFPHPSLLSLALGASTINMSAAFNPCQVTYTIVNQWPGGFQANITIRNIGSTPTNGWTVTLRFADGQTIIIRNSSWNAVIPPGGSVSTGFLSTSNGQSSSPTITCSFT